MSDPKLREARIAEAKRRAEANIHNGRYDQNLASSLYDLIESDWRPEPEVDAVTLAAREWAMEHYDNDSDRASIKAGAWTTTETIFRAGHAHALANHPDAKRMDWLEGQLVTVWERGILHDQSPNDPLRTKIDRAMEGGE